MQERRYEFPDRTSTPDSIGVTHWYGAVSKDGLPLDRTLTNPGVCLYTRLENTKLIDLQTFKDIYCRNVHTTDN